MYKGQEPRTSSGQDQTKSFRERKGLEEKTFEESTQTTYAPARIRSTETRPPSTRFKFPLSWRQVLFGVVLALVFSHYWSGIPKTIKVNGVAKTLPPGSKSGLKVPVPFLGETLEFQMSPYKFFQNRNEKYGKVWYSNLLLRDTIAVSGSEGMDKFYDRKYVTRDTPFSWNLFGGAGSHNFNMLDNTKTDHNRRKVNVEAFEIREVTESWMPAIEETISRFIKIWNKEKSFHWNPQLQDMMAAINSIILLGKPGSEKTIQPLADQTLRGMNSLPIPGPFTNWGAAQRATSKAKNYYLSLIHQRKNNETSLASGKDVLTTMTRAFLRGDYDSEDRVASEIHQFWIANSGLLANILAGMTMHISLNKHTWEKARKEVLDQVPSGPLTLEKLDDLTYLSKVIDESRRLDPTPPAMFARVKTGFELYGYYIPEGFTIAGDFWDTNHDANEWTNPWEFDPDRFDRGEPRGGPMAWVPHGRAHHQCPELDFTGYIMKSLLVHLLRDCTWELPKQNFDWDLSQFTPELYDGLKVKNFHCVGPKHSLMHDVKESLEGIASNLKEKIIGTHDVTEKVKETTQAASEKVKDSAKDAYNKAKKSTEGVAEQAKETLEAKYSDVKETTEDKLKKTQKAAEEMGEKVKEKTNEAIKTVEEKAYNIKESATEKGEHLKEKLKEKLADAGEVGSELKENIKAKGYETLEYMEEVAQDKAEHLKEKAQEAREKIKEKAQDVKGTLEEKAEGAKETLRETVKDTTYKTGQTVEDTGKTIKKQAEKM